jgi:eukaryotic-like serine/threonine-protein kinase
LRLRIPCTRFACPCGLVRAEGDGPVGCGGSGFGINNCLNFSLKRKGPRINNYQMEKYHEIEKIHTGESADLFEVEDSTGNIFIKKQLTKSADNDQKKRFLNELLILTEINSDFFISIVDYNEEGDFPYFIMPKANMNLREYSRQNFGYSQIGIFDQIVQGIQVLHNKKILHLDLNPNNVLIFINSEGSVSAKISDMGLSMGVDEVKNVEVMNDGFHGTPPYIPYRDMRSIRDADFSSDIFNLGRILHRILTGKQCTFSSEFLDEGGYFGVIIKRSFFEDNKDRYYHTIEEFIKDLEEAKKEIKMN